MAAKNSIYNSILESIGTSSLLDKQKIFFATDAVYLGKYFNPS
jgi:hypothetical protein